MFAVGQKISFSDLLNLSNVRAFSTGMKAYLIFSSIVDIIFAVWLRWRLVNHYFNHGNIGYHILTKFILIIITYGELVLVLFGGYLCCMLSATHLNHIKYESIP